MTSGSQDQQARRVHPHLGRRVRLPEARQQWWSIPCRTSGHEEHCPGPRNEYGRAHRSCRRAGEHLLGRNGCKWDTISCALPLLDSRLARLGDRIRRLVSYLQHHRKTAGSLVVKQWTLVDHYDPKYKQSIQSIIDRIAAEGRREKWNGKQGLHRRTSNFVVHMDQMESLTANGTAVCLPGPLS